ncbi:DUF1467 family protein [Xinfangfangia sp. D13-10-4-6]|uniref:DUF1467 family protein n=1 Tax=Pseudogemmobacter hezensis TaxID=2737662 RepID=UPI001551E90A|nr:DUF1467 family protein [Pseudogemmobacter hezensis]NPD15486.1 DUF1467 family protein [Pseudogemmobacter hezensis]
MNLTSAIVLFAITWFLTFYIVLQLRTRTQAEAGEVVPGTPPGAPAEETVGRSALIATGFAAVIWAAISGVILSGWFTIYDIDFRGVLDKDAYEQAQQAEPAAQ